LDIEFAELGNSRVQSRRSIPIDRDTISKRIRATVNARGTTHHFPHGSVTE